MKRSLDTRMYVLNVSVDDSAVKDSPHHDTIISHANQTSNCPIMHKDPIAIKESESIAISEDMVHNIPAVDQRNIPYTNKHVVQDLPYTSIRVSQELT
jgi:hypothetical protein